MPELPEVKTTVDELAQKIIGCRIIDFWTDVPKRVAFFFDGDIDTIKGSAIEGIERRGKNIIISLLNGKNILIHQKISGHLLLGKWKKEKEKWVPSKEPLLEKINSYIHFILFLDNGEMIAMSDPRKFAKIEFWTKDKLEAHLKKILGPDALEIDFEDLSQILSKRGGSIKSVLMDQPTISGIGNIYSDEILWDSKISPFKKSKELSRVEMKRIFNSMEKILNLAIELKGDSMSDYRLIDGTKGGYQNFHKVYQREGLNCFRKDGGKIKREKFGSRSVRFCPVCQK